MSPECLYWLALALLVLPSLPFNWAAVVVLAVWAFGHFAHLAGPYEDAAYMVARIVGFGATLRLSEPWDGSRKALATAGVAMLFLPSAFFSAYVAIYPDAGYSVLIWIYWMTWACIIAQAVLVPVGNDWKHVRRVLDAVDRWVMRRVEKHFGEAL